MLISGVTGKLVGKTFENPFLRPCLWGVPEGCHQPNLHPLGTLQRPPSAGASLAVPH